MALERPVWGDIRGDLIRWARTQHNLTMKAVRAQGGPSPSYQSEVEKGSNQDMAPDLLVSWAKALQVTVPFIRGEVPRYLAAPEQCKGLAADVGVTIMSGRLDLPAWPDMEIEDRTRAVASLIVRESRRLPEVVLAYVLSIELTTLRSLLSGELSITPHIKPLADLTMLPVEFFDTGRLDSLGDLPDLKGFLPVLTLASTLQITPEDLLDFVREWPGPKTRNGVRPGGPPSTGGVRCF